MSSPTVSVIMNCLNGERYLKEAIDSVYAQTFTDWEIIFWDNCSKDKSAKIAYNYDSKVKYFLSDKFGTLGYGRNRAFRAASGKYLAILDVDDLWMPTKLEEQVRLMEKNNAVGLSFTNSTFFGDNDDWYSLFSKNPPPQNRDDILGELLGGGSGFISSESTMYRKSVLDEFGIQFDDNFTMVVDYEVMLRCALVSKVDYVDKELSKWRIHGQNESIKHQVLVPTENIHMLNRMLSSHPELERDYPNEVKEFRITQQYLLGMERWKQNKKFEAIKFFYPYIFKVKFFRMMVLALLFNFEHIAWMRKKLRF